MNKNFIFIEQNNEAEGALSYDFEDLLRADAEIICKDTFGSTYKATMESGKAVFVRRLSSKTTSFSLSHEEFNDRIQEIVKLTRIHNANLHPLKAYYYSDYERLLISDYMPMGCLFSLLHKRGETNITLTWKVRAGIAYEVANGIANLHSQGTNICHGNIRSSSVLLSNFFNVCLSDFGFTRLCIDDVTLNTSSSYQAPEMQSIKNITQKADVYSFGVLLLELLTGKLPRDVSDNFTKEGVELATWVRSMFQEKPIIDVFDNMLRDYSHNCGRQMVQMLQLAICCTFQNPNTRPSMLAVTNRIKEVCQL